MSPRAWPRFILLLAVSGAVRAESLLTVNAPALVAPADLAYDRPASRSEAGLPIGNGRTGSLVWTEPSAVKLQVNRVDVFGNDSSSQSFPERNSDYCGGCASLDVVFAGAGAEVFPAAGTTEHLSCYEGRATIQGRGVTVEALAWADGDVLALQVEDRRENPGEIRIDLRTLRPPQVRTGAHLAASECSALGRQIGLSQQFREADYFCGSAVVVGVAGREVRSQAMDDRTSRLTVAAGRGRFTVLVASAAGFDRSADLAASAGQALAAAAGLGFDGLAKANLAWWGDFWSRSFIHLHSADGVADRIERNYLYYLYVMGSTSRGRFPTKFNGMLWSTGGDLRRWGGQFWGANQSCYYNNALFAADQLELMDPMFAMYTGMAASCAVAARQEWGSQGIYLPETVGFDGLGALPDDIAAEMPDLYLLKKPWAGRSQRFLDYAASMMGYSSRWNWISAGKWVGGKWVYTERGGGPYGPTSHILSRGAKIAYQYWVRYDYTGDVGWLRDRAYPMLKGVAEFYRNFPNLTKGADGRYHLHQVNDNEALWGGQDTAEEISSLRGILPVAIEAAEVLKVDAGLRASWQELLDHLAPLATGGAPGAPTWVKGLDPVVHGRASALPDANTMPMWFFDLCTLDSAPAMLQVGNATFDAFFPSGFAQTRRGAGILSKLPLTAAILGRAEAVRRLIPAQLGEQDPAVLANRMDEREGPQTTGIERLGNAADALHTALCQDLPGAPGGNSVLRVFPAWPAEWDAAFTLRCRGGFRVTAAQRHGQIEFVEIQSLLGRECRLHNPWGASSVTAYRDGERAETKDGALLLFDLAQGKTLRLVRTGTEPEQFKETIPAASPPVQPSR